MLVPYRGEEIINNTLPTLQKEINRPPTCPTPPEETTAGLPEKTTLH